MFDLIDGLPLHPLVVHAVVVLLPLAAAGAVGIAVIPPWRRRFGVLVALVATAGTAMVPVATRSGDAFMLRQGPPAGDHQQLGGQLLWYALALTLLTWLLVMADLRVRRSAAVVGPSELRPGPATTARGEATGRPTTTRTTARVSDSPPAPAGRGLVTALAILTVLAALATAFHVYRVGESGARSVWGDVGATATLEVTTPQL